ncbi:hypothetical protein [Actomonas aquatica]|uniref:Glycosyltransferase RgtA/B/C/D-like domain-containing protein n=1 Tax=Actomonas aquatica TaxID=2866162 RepID=A0ABZ1CBB0_9BACT|nr:hypothetical protein [Opitutus sp. WL0086]WRQ88523.1 hypothetical protein K1X11_003850 [Opitutus sp. WL0086]
MLTWFAAAPIRYEALVWLTFGLLTLSSVLPAMARTGAPPRWQRRIPVWGFVLLVSLCFQVARWPWWFAEREINVDESQMIAEAITLQQDPVFWRSVDGTTHGPLDAYPLLLAKVLGLPLDHGSARLIGTLLRLIAVLAAYGTFRRFWDEDVARLMVLPPLLFLGLGTNLDFGYYTSEVVPIALLSVGLWGTVHPVARPGSNLAWCAGALALGAAPWAKLQAAPIAAALLAWLALAELRRHRWWGIAGWKRVALLTTAAAAPTVGFVLMTLATGQFAYAWESYIQQNLSYTSAHQHDFAAMIGSFWSFTSMGPGVTPLFGGALICVAALGFGLCKTSDRHLGTAIAGVFAASSFYATLAPGRLFPHYLMLLVLPATVLAAAALQSHWTTSSTAGSRPRRVALVLGWLGLLVLPLALSRAQHPHSEVARLPDLQAHKRGAVARHILQLASPGDAMGHWGWMPRYYVQTRLRMATRVAHSERCIMPSPLSEHWRAIYLADLTATRPPVFIDTVGPGSFAFTDRSQFGHESFPALAAFIAANYTLIADRDGTRIYQLRPNP